MTLTNSVRQKNAEKQIAAANVAASVLINKEVDIQLFLLLSSELKCFTHATIGTAKILHVSTNPSWFSFVENLGLGKLLLTLENA